MMKNNSKRHPHSPAHFTAAAVRVSFWLGILAFLLYLPQSQAYIGESFTDDNFKYTVLSEEGTDGTVSVAKQSDTVPSGAVTIPASVTRGSVTYSVASIGTSGFHNCTSLTSITIPESVTCFEDRAFASCSSLTSVTMGNGVTNIGNHAFDGCYSMWSITIPDGVTSIGEKAFYGCGGLLSITIPDSVTTIGSGAFQICTSLTNVVMGKSVVNIGSYAFDSCYRLKSVYFKGDAPIPDVNVFRGCSALSTIYYVEGTEGWTNPWQGIATATWTPEPEPTVPELAFAIEDGKLILRWAVSSNAMLEVSPQASGGLWTHAGVAEIKDGTWYYEVPLSSGAGYYRLVAE